MVVCNILNSSVLEAFTSTYFSEFRYVKEGLSPAGPLLGAATSSLQYQCGRLKRAGVSNSSYTVTASDQPKKVAQGDLRERVSYVK